MMRRMCELRVGEEMQRAVQAVTLGLGGVEGDVYTLQAGSWREREDALEMGVVVREQTLEAVDARVGAIRRLLALAEGYATALHGEPVYVYTKACDELSRTAELGATWRRKRVYGGTVTVPDVSALGQGRYSTTLQVTLQTERWWRRAATASAVEGGTGVAPHTMFAGGLLAGGAVTARRRGWDETTGVTVRYFWQAATVNCYFLRAGGNWEAWWEAGAQRFKMKDSGGNLLQTGILVLEGLVEVTFVWEPGVGMRIYVGGELVAVRGGCALTKPGLVYTLLEPTGTQGVASVQVWAWALTGEEIKGLAGWGMPQGELCLVRPPANELNTGAMYAILNVPGQGPMDLRLLLASNGSQDYGKVLLGLRPLRVAGTTSWECEGGVLGTGVTLNSNVEASGGSQVRVTPTDTAWTGRVTLTLAALPAMVRGLVGEHRLLLAGVDGAAAVQRNLLRWRLAVAGVAGPWSEALAFGSVGVRSVLELGTLSLPEGAWSSEALVTNSQVYSGNYVTLEIETSNVMGSGGGVLDLDALYLFPLELTGVALGVLDVSGVQMALDFANDPVATTLVADEQQMEWGGWVRWQGDALALLPELTSEGAGLLRVLAFRDEDETARPNDTVDVRVFVRPSWG